MYLGNAKSSLATVTEDQELSTTTDLRSFDFNADGVPEVWYTRQESGPEGGSDDLLSAFTISSAEVKPFDLAGANVVRDVDGDGRPDLLLELRNPELRLSCPGSAFESVEGATFLLHSLASGAFSATDEIARAFVRHSCPRAPARVVEPSKTGGGYVDDEKTAVNVVCARAWGMPLAALQDALKTGCQPFAPRADCENDLRPRPHECRYRDELLRWAELTPVIFTHD